ncbi:9982_t:CDS:2 [Funneliformis caledonium]|uniref:9982_t:CDS:1 n=1 Tax=Funneliformis caledonium TaxID=1117310 RepID=A0A9N9NAB6_9GLOM|nr:9982_t:CDS:2 [Funneliformis caledonium]
MPLKKKAKVIGKRKVAGRATSHDTATPGPPTDASTVRRDTASPLRTELSSAMVEVRRIWVKFGDVQPARIDFDGDDVYVLKKAIKKELSPDLDGVAVNRITLRRHGEEEDLRADLTVIVNAPDMYLSLLKSGALISQDHFLSQILPAIHYIERLSSITTHGGFEEPKKISSWIDYFTEVNNFNFENLFLSFSLKAKYNKPTFVDTNHVVRETDVQNALQRISPSGSDMDGSGLSDFVAKKGFLGQNQQPPGKSQSYSSMTQQSSSRQFRNFQQSDFSNRTYLGYGNVGKRFSGV